VQSIIWPTSRRFDSTSAGPESRRTTHSSRAFNGSVRRELLSQHYFSTLAEARSLLDQWRREYNGDRPHSSLGDLSSADFRVTVEDCRINATETKRSIREPNWMGKWGSRIPGERHGLAYVAQCLIRSRTFTSCSGNRSKPSSTTRSTSSQSMMRVTYDSTSIRPSATSSIASA
jgi:hypothetical protein